MSRTERLSHEEEIQLTRRLTKYKEEGNDKMYRRTLDRLVTHNLGLVNKLVSKFPMRSANCSFDDLFQEGVAGLIHGIRKFDPTRGYRLSTYVYNWISVYVRRYYQNHGRTVRLPIHVADRQYQLKRKIEELTEELGRTPSAEEISQLDKDSDKILSSMRNVVSLNGLVGEDTELSDLIMDEKEYKYDQFYDCDMILANVRGQISRRDFDIVMKRFGMLGDQPMTLSEVADEYKITRARVHQIEKGVLRKMKEVVKG